MRLRSEDKHHLRKPASKSTNQSGERNERPPDLCFSICRFSEVVFILRAQPHAQSLFLFPVVLGVNLIHFFDEKKDGAAGNSIVCFGASIPCHAIWQKQNEERELFRRAQRFWQQKVWTQRPSRGEKLRCIFLARKSAKFLANFSVFATKGAKFLANFSATKVTSLPSHSLSLSLSLSLYLSLSLAERTSRTI